MVPGHEIGGYVIEVGSSVSKFKIGDIVGVGCMVDSCRQCIKCRAGREQYCLSGPVYTYNDTHRYSHCAESGTPTFGGYSETILVNHLYVVKIPTNLDLAAATPLLCAGITVYSPMMHFGLRPNMKVAIIGLGGLGHMAVKLAVAFGCDVTVISRGLKKKEEAVNRLHAHSYLDSTNTEEMKAATGSFDFILSTISAPFDINPFVQLLAIDGKLVNVGAPPSPTSIHLFPLIVGRKSIAGSLIGGIKETQDMLDFCGRHNITCDIELISADKINEAYDRVVASDVKYRFVIDASTL
jgi:uncharacterized zinc-type alcohol dehydrogenase-like protein